MAGLDIDELLTDAAKRYGMDPEVVRALANTESNLNPNAVSPKGAAGVMQLMPATARELGVRNLTDPAENIDAGVRYLKQMNDRYGGDLDRALAAYNAGPRPVDAHKGIPPYRETQDYVARIKGRIAKRANEVATWKDLKPEDEPANQVATWEPLPEPAPPPPQPQQEQPQQRGAVADTGIGISAATAPSITERLWAPIRDSSVGRAFGISTESAEARKENPDRFLNFEAAIPDVGPGIVRGAAQFASGLTTPGNLLLMAGTGGLGALEGQLGKSLVSRLVSAGFSGQMLKGVYDQYPGLRQAWDQGDWGNVRQILTGMTLGLGMAGLAGAHALKGKPGVTPIEENRQVSSDLPANRPAAPEAKPALFELAKPEPAEEVAPVAPPAEKTATPRPVEEAANQIESWEPLPAAAGEPAVEPPPPAPGIEPPLETPAAEPEPVPQGTVTLASGLGALQPVYDKTVAHLQKSLQEMGELKAERDQGLAAAKAAQVPATLKAAGQTVRQTFTGERDRWRTGVNQLIIDLKKQLPKQVDQEALSLYRDFKDKPGQLEQWRDGTHPDMPLDPDDRLDMEKKVQRLTPVIDRALNPTPAMMKADTVLTGIADMTLQEGRSRGFLDSSIEPANYVPHMLRSEEPMPLSDSNRLVGNRIGRNFAFGQERHYPTLMDALASGGKDLRTLNALDAFTIHADKFGTARATHMLVDKLKQASMGKWSTSQENVPMGWKPAASHSNLFKNRIALTDPNTGQAHVATQSLYVPEFIDQALSPITDPNYSQKITGLKKLREVQRASKSLELALSLFHLGAENLMGAYNMGLKYPKAAFETLRGPNMESPAFRQAERRLVGHGGTTPALEGPTYEAYRSLKPSAIPSWTDIAAKAPVLRQIDSTAKGISKFTFDRTQRYFKVTDFNLKANAWEARNPNATAAERTAALRSIAKQINSTYGGLHWENMGWNRMGLEFTRALFLAPDWLVSNIMSVKGLADPRTAGTKLFSMQGLKERAIGSEGARNARMFWARAIVSGLAATQGMSMLMSGQHSERPFQVYYGKDDKGQDIYQNVFFKGAPGDMVTFATDAYDYGPVMGPLKFFASKAAPIVRELPRVLSNRDYVGNELVNRDLNFTAKAVRGVGTIAKDVVPVPFSFKNFYDTLAGEKSDDYKLWEPLTSIFFGQAPKHVPPEGYYRDKEGNIVPKRYKAPSTKSTWEQITTGKP